MTVSPTTFFADSSHHSRWILGEQETLGRRSNANNTTCSKIEATCPELELLSLTEESLLCNYYAHKIPELCKFLGFNEHVLASALMLHRRFYLARSLIEHDPKHVMLTCVFLATKIEDLHLTLDDFAGKIPNVNREFILQLEFVVLEAVDFDLLFFHPFAPLNGFYEDWKRRSQSQRASDVDAVYLKAQEIATTMLLCDIAIRFTPSHIALAALSETADSTKDQAEFGRYISHIRSHSKADLDKDIADIRAILSTLKSPDPAVLKPIDRKLIQIRHALHKAANAT